MRTSRRGRHVATLAAAGMLAVAGGLVSAGAGGSSAAADPCPAFFVAPDGDDNAKGTITDPWHTIEHARDHIRDKQLNTSPRMHCDITVNLRAGDYPVTETITFDERDSGTGGHQVVYRSYDGPGQARFIGGEAITGWQPYQDGIYKTTIDTDQPFYTLFEDGDRSTMARYPNRESEETWAPYLVSVLGEPEKEAVRQWLYWEEGDWDPAWDDTAEQNPLKNAQLTVWSGGSWSWFTDIVPIGGADYRKNFATLEYWTRYAMMNSRSGSRYFIQNALPFLDQPGEYYLDYEAGELYYKPRDGNIEDSTIIRPTVQTVFELAGSSPEDRVHDLVLDGLAVKYTDFMPWYRYGWISDGDSGEVHKYPQYDRQIEMPRNRHGAITLTNTRNITLTGMHLADTGYHAVYMLFHNDHVTIENSLLENLGADGIKVEGGYPGEGNHAHHNTFRNNYIHHVGELVPGDAAGIELMNTSDNLIEHIVVEHSARYGISLESRPEVSNPDNYSGNNTVEYVRLAHLGKDSGDTGAFYAYGVHNEAPWFPPSSRVSQVVIEDVNANPSMPDGPPHGVHMDFGGCAFEFADIVVTHVQGDEYHAGDTVCNEFDNVSWQEGFDESRIEYDEIGVTSEFPYALPTGD